MQRTSAVFTPLNAYRNSLTVPSSHFTLEPVSISPANKAKKQAPKADNLAGSGTASKTKTTMSTRRVYDCFDSDKKGHFQAVDELFEKGVWIGYFAEESRDTRYRGLPSYHDLEKNHANLSLPFPEPLQNNLYSDREAVCRGCFSDSSSVLQLKEIRFGPRHKVVVMPLQGADEAGLFCIMLPQSLDRSIKALDLFRPYEHGIDRNDSKSFANETMLLAVRDRDNSGSGILSTVRKTLDPVELATIADRSSSPNSSAQNAPRPTAENIPQSGGQPRFKAKRKQQQPDGEDSASGGPVKRNRQVPLKGPRMSEHIVSLSDDDLDDVPLIPKARGLTSRPRVQQPTPVSPSSALNPSSIQAPRPPVVFMNHLQFTDEQVQRIFFVWKIEFEGEDAEVRRSLSAYGTFRKLLESFREDANIIPSAAQQIQAKLWLMRYELAGGKGKTVFVKPASPDFEHSFDSILRHLAENEEWKKNKSMVIEIEVRAITSGGD